MLGSEARVPAVAECSKDSQAESAAPCTSGADCPICLGDDIGYKDRATVHPCMHAFCHACLSQWLDVKRTCPLCKGRVRSYFYNVSPDGNYDERLVPQSPPRPADASFPQPRMLPLIDESWSQGPNLYTTADFERRGRRSRWSEEPFVRPNNARTMPRRVQHFRTPGAQEQSEPRPYYHRIRAFVSAHGRQQGDSVEAGPVSEETQLLLFRRHIYSSKLYAVPTGSEFGSRAPDASHRRLQTWVMRELKALLQAEDVSLLTSLVMGVAMSFKAMCRPSEQQPGSNGQAVQALAPYLESNAQHFWHELRCFARAPYSLQTYDRLVRYSSEANCQESTSGTELMGFDLWRAQNFRGGLRNLAVPSNAVSGSSGPSLAAENTSQPVRGQARECLVCSTTRARQGLCLDCAEREALEEEQASAAPPTQNLQPAISLTSDPAAVPDAMRTASRVDTGGEPDAAEMLEQGGGHISVAPRVSFALTSEDRGRGRPEQSGSQRHKRRRVGTEVRRVSGIRRDGIQPSHSWEQQAPAVASGRSAGRAIESTLQSSTDLQDLGSNRQQCEAQGSELIAAGKQVESSQQQRNAYISKLAAERLRCLLGGDSPGSSHSSQAYAFLAQEASSHTRRNGPSETDPHGHESSQRRQSEEEIVILLSGSDTESDTGDEVICLTPHSQPLRQTTGVTSQRLRGIQPTKFPALRHI